MTVLGVQSDWKEFPTTFDRTIVARLEGLDLLTAAGIGHFWLGDRGERTAKEWLKKNGIERANAPGYRLPVYRFEDVRRVIVRSS